MGIAYPKTMVEIAVKKIFVPDFTWEYLENFFGINRRILKCYMEQYLSEKENTEKTLDRVLRRIELNYERKGV